MCCESLRIFMKIIFVTTQNRERLYSENVFIPECGRKVHRMKIDIVVVVVAVGWWKWCGRVYVCYPSRTCFLFIKIKLIVSTYYTHILTEFSTHLLSLLLLIPFFLCRLQCESILCFYVCAFPSVMIWILKLSISFGATCGVTCVELTKTF